MDKITTTHCQAFDRRERSDLHVECDKWSQLLEQMCHPRYCLRGPDWGRGPLHVVRGMVQCFLFRQVCFFQPSCFIHYAAMMR
jgi:hypothetical protein